MTLIVGAQCKDGVVLAADRRRMARHEIGPDTNKLFKLDNGVALAGAGDDAVLNEARILIERRAEGLQNIKLFDIVEITCGVVNELVGLYRDKVEEPFGYVIVGLEDVVDGSPKLYTIFGAGLSDVPWVCLGSGSAYARPIVELLLTDGSLSIQDAIKLMPFLYTLVSSVQTTVGGGVDICVVKDGKGAGDIQHEDEIDLKPLKSVVLDTLGIKV